MRLSLQGQAFDDIAKSAAGAYYEKHMANGLDMIDLGLSFMTNPQISFGDMTTMQFVDKIKLNATAVGEKPQLLVDLGPIDVKASAGVSLDYFLANKTLDFAVEFSNAALHTEMNVNDRDDLMAIAFDDTDLTMDKHGTKVRVAVDGLFDWSRSFDEADILIREAISLLEFAAENRFERYINNQVAPMINGAISDYLHFVEVPETMVEGVAIDVSLAGSPYYTEGKFDLSMKGQFIDEHQDSGFVMEEHNDATFDQLSTDYEIVA